MRMCVSTKIMKMFGKTLMIFQNQGYSPVFQHMKPKFLFTLGFKSFVGEKLTVSTKLQFCLQQASLFWLADPDQYNIFNFNPDSRLLSENISNILPL